MKSISKGLRRGRGGDDEGLDSLFAELDGLDLSSAVDSAVRTRSVSARR
jgi:hypothetical protein